MAARFSDRIVVLDRGEKIADGPAGEIICEDILKPVYRIDLVVRDNVLTSSPEIVPLRSSKDTTRRLNGKRYISYAEEAAAVELLKTSITMAGK